MSSPTVPKKSGYIRGLDGWRGIAILCVLIAHDRPWSLFGHTNASWHAYGGWGVWLFFALSGYLVCHRILRDEERRGRFDIVGFYKRRLFRIQPAALVYVATISLLTLAGVMRERTSCLVAAVFMYENYLFHHADLTGTWNMTGHFWTLAVEEHFYIVLSLCFLAVRRYRALVLGALSLAFLFWFHFHIYFTHYRDALDHTRYSEFNLQFLLIPALLAVLLQNNNARRRIAFLLRPWSAFAFTALLILALDLRSHTMSYPSAVVFSHPYALFLCFGLWIVATAVHQESWTVRCLEFAPLRYLGRLSYSIYLWHVPIFFAGPQLHIHAPWLLALTERPWRYVATFTAACLSYYLIEHPLQRLGHRIAPPSTDGHKDLAPVTA